MLAALILIYVTFAIAIFFLIDTLLFMVGMSIARKYSFLISMLWPFAFLLILFIYLRAKLTKFNKTKL